MKPFTSMLLAFVMAISWSCTSESPKESKDEKKQTSDKQENIDEAKEHKLPKPELEKRLPIFNKFLQGEPQLQKQVEEYMMALDDKASIVSEEDIIKILEMRRALLQVMRMKASAYYGRMEDYDQIIQSSDNLEKIGIRIATAEGMFGDFVEAALLEDKVKELGSPAFQLYMEFLKWSGQSIGGEYPYLDLVAEMEMVRIGEEMEAHHRDSKYYKEIEMEYHWSMLTLTQIHASLEGSNSEFYLLGNYDADLYPFMTEIELFTQFISEYSGTRLSQMTEKILDNLSSVDFKKDSVYVIAVGTCPEPQSCQDSLARFLKDEMDIPYQITFSQDDGQDIQYWMAYRFYTDKEMAEKELVKAREMREDAEIVALPMRMD